jgi:hypothetical protein
VLYRQGQPPNFPTTEGLGLPIIQLLDSIEINDTIHNHNSIYWVDSVNTTFDGKDYKTNLTLTPHEPWASYQIFPVTDVNRFIDIHDNPHAVVDISLTDTDGTVRYVTASQSQYERDAYSMYESEGSAIKYVGGTEVIDAQRYLKLTYTQLIPGYISVKIVAADGTEQDDLHGKVHSEDANGWNGSPYVPIMGGTIATYLVGEMKEGTEHPEFRDPGDYTLYWDATDQVGKTHHVYDSPWVIGGTTEGETKNLYVAPGRYEVIITIIPIATRSQNFEERSSYLPDALNNSSQGSASATGFYKVFYDVWRYYTDARVDWRFRIHGRCISEGNYTGTAGVDSAHEDLLWFYAEDNDKRGLKMELTIGNLYDIQKVPRHVDFKVVGSHFVATRLASAVGGPSYSESYPKIGLKEVAVGEPYGGDYWLKDVYYGTRDMIQYKESIVIRDWSSYKPYHDNTYIYYRPDTVQGGLFKFEGIPPTTLEYIKNTEALNGNAYNLYQAHAFEITTYIVDKSGFYGVAWMELYANGNLVGPSLIYAPYCDLRNVSPDLNAPNMMGILLGDDRLTRQVAHVWWVPYPGTEFAQDYITHNCSAQYESTPQGSAFSVLTYNPFVENLRLWGYKTYTNVWPPMIPHG